MATNDTQQVTTTASIHRQLQELAARELALIPQHLEQMTPAERVRFVLALLPYTAPKVETCTTDYGKYGDGWL